MMEHTTAELDDLIEQEKRLAAREVHVEAWNEGLLEGIDSAFLAEAAMATALEETIRLEGEESALAMIEALRERVVTGEFSPNRIMQ